MRSAAIFVVGLVLGAVLLGLARFQFGPRELPVHYHANWAVMVNGERLDLSGDEFMADVTRCTVGQMTALDRVHMHENVDDVVHVHDDGVTWGHFLQNLGFAAGEDYLITPWGDRYAADEEHALRFVLNGQILSGINSEMIRSQDRLLISYDTVPTDHVLEEQFPTIARTAANYDQAMDPAGCAGVIEPGLWEGLKRAFWG